MDKKQMPLEDIERLDMAQKPRRVAWYLRPVTWLIAFPSIWRHHSHITKINMEGVKKPYLMLCNHNAFYDFMIATKATFPHQAYYIVAIDAFVGGGGLLKWLMYRVGCIPKRKFTNDVRLVRQLKQITDRGKIVAFYPEARYSLVGTNAVLPPSLGKLVKLLKVPVVTLMTQGHHVNAPFWNTHDRKLPTRAVMKQILTVDQIERMSYEDIIALIDKEFFYDDFAWQKENKIRTTYKKRAQGLHKVLYQCPHCKTEYRMESSGTELWCNHCGHRWTMDEYSELHAVEGETYFSHVPTWFNWERENVRQEVLAGTYGNTVTAAVRSLPNPRRFIDIGDAQLTHNMEGFHLKGLYKGFEYSLTLPVKQLYSVHIEFSYLKWKRDCIDLSTLTDTFFIFPYGDDFSVTKMSLATEELYNKESGVYDRYVEEVDKIIAEQKEQPSADKTE